VHVSVCRYEIKAKLNISHSYTSYTAGVMTAHKATQKALHGDPFTDDMELLSKCIGVLEYCAQKDALAGRFRDLLTAHLNTLREHNASTDRLATSTNLPMNAYLFTYHAGSSTLHAVAHDLLRLIHRPFSGLKNVVTQKTLSNRAETTMGTHLEWEYELKGAGCAENQLNKRVCLEPTNPVPQPLCVGDEEMQRLMKLPNEGAWSTWTPLTWQTSFPGLTQ
jgi:hypothetical protein